MRSAVIVGVSEYSDETIGNIPGVAADSARLSKLLEAERVGGFDHVSLLLNPGYQEGVDGLNSLFGGRDPDDLLLLHIISQMSRDAEGRLHFLLSDSILSDPRSTAMSADWLSRQIARCRCARIVVMIDGSCPGGPPKLVVGGDDARGMSSNATSVAAFPPFGRALIAYEASIATSNSTTGMTARIESFTHAVCGGLVSGAADMNGDGDITVDDLYGYLKEELLLQVPCKIPLLQTDGTHSGALVVARNSALAPAIPAIAPLSTDVRRLLRSYLVIDRLKAIDFLAALKRSGSYAEIQAATLALHELMRNDDSLRVRESARAIIAPWSDLGGGDFLIERDNRSLSAPSVAMNIYILNSKVQMSQQGSNWVSGDQAGGDVNKQIAGRDITGAAAGRDNRAIGSVQPSQDDSLAGLREALAMLTEDVSAASIEVADKINALTALQWFQENVSSADEPSEATEQVGKLKAVGGWVWDKFKSILHDLPSAGLAAWIYDLAQHLLTQ